LEVVKFAASMPAPKAVVVAAVAALQAVLQAAVVVHVWWLYMLLYHGLCTVAASVMDAIQRRGSGPDCCHMVVWKERPTEHHL
jgi:hypothetical protein